MLTESPAPAVWMSADGHAWDVFPRETAPTWTYEAVQIAPNGTVSAPADVFGTAHWNSLQFGPTLLPSGNRPILIFDGSRGTSGPYSRGCVYGILAGSATWTLEPWTLSHDCVNPQPGAAESRTGTLAAAWPGGWATGSGINYRVGISAAIPAVSDDQHILLSSAAAERTGMANDLAGTGHFYVAWVREFSHPSSLDGLYARDVTGGGAAMKAPGTGTSSVNDFPVFGAVATTSTNTHPGVFVAYCANVSPCQLRLWRAGATTSLAVPSSGNAFGVSIAPGPGGRLWIAWVNSKSNDVYVTRTNKADTKFGAVLKYRTPCAEYGLLGLGAGSYPRLDIGMQCVNTAALKNRQYVTQVFAGLTVSPGTVTITNTAFRTVTFTVTDAGTPVQGAIVKVAGKTVTTNAAGKATFHFAVHFKTGSYLVTASAPNYSRATGKLIVKR